MSHCNANVAVVVFLFLLLPTLVCSDAGAQFLGRTGGDGLPRKGLVQHVLTKVPEYDEANGSWVSPDRVGDESRAIHSGHYYDFDDEAGHVEADSINEVTSGTPGALSVFIYVRADAVQNERAFASHYDTSADNRGWTLGFRNSQYYYVRISEDGTYQNRKEYYFVIDDTFVSVWHEYGFTFGSGTLKLYIDGVEVDATKASDSTFESPYQSSAPTCLGSLLITGVHYMFVDADIKDVRVYNRALSPTEISAAYQDPNQIPVSGLEAFFKCEEEDGSTAYDSSGNGVHGAITDVTLETFHAESMEAPHSWSNEVGYTETSGVVIPRDESDTDKDVLGNDLEFTGRAKLPVKITGADVLEFDGIESRVLSVDDSAEIITDTGNFSVSCYFSANTIASASYGNRIFTLYRNETSSGISLTLGEHDVLRLIYFDGGLQIEDLANVETDRTYHVVICVDDDVLTAYLDGVPLSPGTLDFNGVLVGKLSIGSYQTINLFGGVISKFVVYNRGLTQSEAQAVYLYGTLPDGSVSMYLPMSESAGSTLYDASGNGHNATMVNFTLPDAWINDDTGKIMPHNLVYGFAQSGDIKIPALHDGSVDATGGSLSNPGGYWHNGAEVVLSQFQAPALWQADQNCGLGYWFSLDGTPLLIGADDIVDTVNPDASCNQFFANCRNGNRKLDLRIYSHEQSGGRLQSINRHYGIK